MGCGGPGGGGVALVGAGWLAGWGIGGPGGPGGSGRVGGGEPGGEAGGQDVGGWYRRSYSPEGCVWRSKKCAPKPGRIGNVEKS